MSKHQAKLARFEAEVEALLAHYGVSPGLVNVWMQNHGAFIRERYDHKSTPGAVAERILEFEREESHIPWKK